MMWFGLAAAQDQYALPTDIKVCKNDLNYLQSPFNEHLSLTLIVLVTLGIDDWDQKLGQSERPHEKRDGSSI
jgi:hypothetical protein